MKWIILLYVCCVYSHQTPQMMFLQFIKEDVQDTQVKEVNQYIEVKHNGQMLIERNKHLATFMKIVNHNDNMCFEMEEETISYIYCYDISHIPDIIFSFTEGEVVFSQDSLFTYSKELSIYIMNICFINDNNNNHSLLNKEETQLIFDNDISEIVFGEGKISLGWGIVIAFFVVVVIPIIVIIIIIIAIIRCIIKKCREYDKENININVNYKKRTDKFTTLFPYEPEDISTPQVVHQMVLDLNNNIDYVLFPQVPIGNNYNN